MKFKYRKENNSRFVNVRMKNLVHETWKRQSVRLHSSWAKTTCIHRPSKAPYLLMVIWKGISQEDLLAPSTHHPRTVLCTQKQTDESFLFFSASGCHVPSVMQANECKCSKVLIGLLSEMHFPGPLPLVLRSNIFQPWRIRFQITSHQRVTEWDCVSVWRSPRIAVCVCV